MRYITRSFNYWKTALIDGFEDLYERHEVNMDTIIELQIYTFVELLLTPWILLTIVVYGAVKEFECHLGKPKNVKKESKEENAP